MTPGSAIGESSDREGFGLFFQAGFFFWCGETWSPGLVEKPIPLLLTTSDVIGMSLVVLPHLVHLKPTGLLLRSQMEKAGGLPQLSPLSNPNLTLRNWV